MWSQLATQGGAKIDGSRGLIKGELGLNLLKLLGVISLKESACWPAFGR